MISKPKINCYGLIQWVANNRMFHREGDKPAIIKPCGTVVYMVNNTIHRDNNKPAIIYPNGIKVYYDNGDKYSPQHSNE